MKNSFSSSILCEVDDRYSLLKACYPVRLLHYAELGVILGCLLVLGVHSIERKAHRWESNVLLDKTVSPQSISHISKNSTDDDHFDRDRDGMPNDWELANSHDPDFAGDAASDFDNDGLTTLQEYQLWCRTSGQAGNPLGYWDYKETAIDDTGIDTTDFAHFHQSFHVAAANDSGDVVIQITGCGEHFDSTWHNVAEVAFLGQDGSIHSIQIPGKTTGYTYAADINERGEVLLQWYSENWALCESYLLKRDNSVIQLTLNGNPCVACRINHFSDWIGWEITEDRGWIPAQVVNGGRIIPADHFPSWSIMDINDFGQIIGTYYDVMEDKNLTFTQLGPMFFSTGREGDFPLFKEANHCWQWPAALNRRGEFAGGAYGYNSQGQWRDSTFFFSGAYYDIRGQEDEHYSYPIDLSETGMVLFSSYSSGLAYDQPYLWRDGVSATCVALFNASEKGENSGYVQPTKLSAHGKVFLTQYDAHWKAQSIVILTPKQDKDEDGMPDDWEHFYGLNPYVHDANLDADHDKTNNLGEYLLRSDPQAAPVIDSDGELIDTRPGVDTDGDGVPNNWEYVNGMNYEDPADAAMDFDRDGYTNLQEFRLNTEPRGARSYRIRQIGPFTGVSGVDISRATLSDGAISANPYEFSGFQNTEEVFFNASISPSQSGPVTWSQLRTEEQGVLAFYPSATDESRTLVAQSPSGAVLTSNNSYPKVFTYWSSPNADPVTLTAIVNENFINELYNATLSPSGKYLFAIRQNCLGIFEPIAWKMPSAENMTFQPVVITAPEGAEIETWLSAYINDYGIITANGSVEGQTRGLVWTMNEYGNNLEGAILSNLSGDNYANVIGLSNHRAPIIAGNALNAEYQERACVWKYISPKSFRPTDLGTLSNGNASRIVKISPNGTLAGIANTLHENELKQHIFCAVPVIPSNSDSIDPTLYCLSPQGEPFANGAVISHVTNAGEIIANIYNASSAPELFLLSKGKSNSLASSIPKSSGYELQEILGFNAQGSLLVIALKDHTQERILLTPDRDTDGDGLPDAWENAHQFNPFSKNSINADVDNDGLTDLVEYANGTHPRITDTDSDGMQDGWEVEWGFLPLDATDALLDPDQDRVNNLREFQIGTIPTGVYKLETKYIDTEWQYPQILGAGDDGGIIRTGANATNYSSVGNEHSYEYSQDVFALASVTSNVTSQIPSNRYSFHYNEDWTKYSGLSSWGNYYVDAASGQIHGARSSYHYRWDSSTSQYFSEESYYLTPNITNYPNESDWIPLDAVENNLRNSDLHNGFPPLSDDESLNRNAACVSPSGIRRLYRSDSGRYYLLNERGEFMSDYAKDHAWQKINDQGIAACYEPFFELGEDNSTYIFRPWLFLSDGQSFLLPHDPGSSMYPDWELVSFSDDGKALLRNGYQTEQFTWTNRYFLYDSTTGKMDRIRMPASEYASVSSLSKNNGRMLIHGSRPCQITPDGTCIRLDALRVTDENHGIPVPLGDLYPNIISASHISSAGKITLTTTHINGYNVIIQITNHNDANCDGLPDDWSLAHNLTNSDADDDGDGLNNSREYALQTDPKKADTDNDGILDSIDADPKVPATSKTDSDGDGIFDLEDAVPNDAEINWKKTAESQYVWIEQVIHDDSIGEPIAINKLGQILFGISAPSAENQSRVLWSSKSQQWINLPTVGTMPIQSPQKFILEMDIGSEEFELESEYYQDINDEGKVFGISNGGALAAGMIWEKVSPESEIYSNPKYIFPKFPLSKIGEQDGDPVYRYGSQVWGGSIAHDGTISAITTEGYDVGLAWSLKDRNDPSDNLSMKKEKNIESGYSYVGAILDKDRALLIEAPWSEENFRIWLKEIGGLTDISFMGGDFAEMSELPSDVNGRVDRLWITTGTNCHIEKRNSGVGVARWHKPASMEGERIIRVSKQGVAITAGSTWQSSPAKLWRNGTYTNLNDSNLTAKPADVKITNAIDIASNGIILVQAIEGGVKKTGFLIPLEVIELSPKVKDEDGNDIAGSEKPNIGKPLSPFIEVDPHANKIAHRELKVKIGELLKDKKVTWTLEPLPGAIPATIRGEWEDSPTHKDRFEVSKAYGANGFRKVSQASGETTVGTDGHTAIRVNVPPIGFNQVRIKIHIEGISTPIDLIDMEVPGVVVIDPGHGGQDSGAVGRTDTSILEKDLALEYSLSLQREVIEKFAAERHGLRIVMTRKTTGEYMENSARANLARDKGADVFISVHFNSGANSARGTETLVRGDSNVNESEDTTLANLFLTSTLSAVKSQDAAAVNRGVKNYAWSKSKQKNVPSQWAVLSDSGYGNTNDYHPIRGSIVEVEFLSHETALESVKLPNARGTAIKTNFASDVSIDIYNNILNQP